MPDHERLKPMIDALADALADLPNPEAWQVLRAVWEARQLLRAATRVTDQTPTSAA
jgi:hypothetical protein